MLCSMSAVDLPPVPTTVTLQEVEKVRGLRQHHEQELHEYEEETRRQRHNLRKLRRELAQKGVKAPSEQQLAEEQAKKAALEAEIVALEAERAKAAEVEAQAKREREEGERQFMTQRSKLEDELCQLREQRRLDEEKWNSCANAGVVPACVGAAYDSNQTDSHLMSRRVSEANSCCSADEPLNPLLTTFASAVPSGAPSAASSAAPSRSNSPSGLDAVGRCSSMPIATVAVAAIADSSETPATGKGAAASVVTAAPAPTPRKGGKGKGKGSAPIPPPPPGSTPRLSVGNTAKPSKYVNLYWKATQKPEVVDLQAFQTDPFIVKIREHSLRDGSDIDGFHVHIDVPDPTETIFSAGVEVPVIPEEMLETYFKRCEAAVRLPLGDSAKQNQGIAGRVNHLGDQKRLNMIGIMLQKHIMKHKEESNREAILNIKRGVLQCDFAFVKLECLSVLRTVLRQHVKDGSPLSSYVQTHGEAAIWDLAYPDHHYLVYELSKVPQIDERLECMLFQLGFCENMVAYRQNLQTLFKGLEALKTKRDLIRRFFVTAHRLGQSLSQKQSRGFQLSTLEKLTQTKSTKMPTLSILHFVLALMSRKDAQELFTTEEISLLRAAKALGTAKVCDECRELAQGLYGVKQICESGEYTCQSTGQSVKIERRRKTLPPRAAAAALSGEPPESDIDTDDRFHEVMQDFVDSYVDEADDLVVECHKMLLLYKELALFFDDLNNVYPPPKDPSDKKLDLVDVFYRFGKVVPQHRQEVEDENLREKIGSFN